MSVLVACPHHNGKRLILSYHFHFDNIPQCVSDSIDMHSADTHSLTHLPPNTFTYTIEIRTPTENDMNILNFTQHAYTDFYFENNIMIVSTNGATAFKPKKICHLSVSFVHTLHVHRPTLGLPDAVSCWCCSLFSRFFFSLSPYLLFKNVFGKFIDISTFIISLLDIFMVSHM